MHTLKLNLRTFLLAVWCLVCRADPAALPSAVVLENAHFRYTISATGTNLGFVDRATGIDYLKPGTASPCAVVRRRGKDYPVTAVALESTRLSLEFGEAGIMVTLKVEPLPAYLRLEVVVVTGGEIESLVFLNVPLALQGKPSESFGACALSLNLITRVGALPALQTELRAALAFHPGETRGARDHARRPPARFAGPTSEGVLWALGARP